MHFFKNNSYNYEKSFLLEPLEHSPKKGGFHWNGWNRNLKDMFNVTYLLGAGASIGVIPTLNDFSFKLKEFSEVINELINSDLESMVDHETRDLTNFTNRSLKDIVISFNQKILQTAELSDLYGSIDSFARKNLRFENKNEPKYNDIINVYTAYIIACENGYIDDYKIDKRYVNLLSNILELSGKSIFRENINIITWNYDNQIEKALDIVTTNKNNSSNGFLIHKKGTNQLHQSNNNVIKLNGSADYLDQNKFGVNFPLLNKLDKTKHEDNLIYRKTCLIKLILYSEYACYNDSIYSNIRFAWNLESKKKENPSTYFDDLEYKIISETEIFVIIGYSFPFFNRNIDNEIINTSKCSKIYIQDLYPDLIENRIRLLAGKKRFDTLQIIKSNDTSRFIVPVEI